MGNKFIEIIKKKWLRSVLLTILLFAIIIAAYVALTYFVEKAKFQDLDFTADKIFSITQQTKDKLKDLNQDITITTYKMDGYISDFADKYTAFSQNIKTEKLENLNAKPEWKSEYGLQDSTQFLAVQSANKTKILYSYDLYTYNYTTGEEVDILEEAITNAILDVITNVKPTISFLVGHNVYTTSYTNNLENALLDEVNEIEHLDILKKGSVSENCKVLVITALKEDITVKERDEILKYIKNGGEILLLMDPNLNKIKTPNFQKILDEYGITSNAEGILLEGNNDNMMYGAPNFIITQIRDEADIKKGINMDLNLCMMNAGKLNLVSTEELQARNVTLQTIATVSEKAFYRTDLRSNSTKKIASDENAADATVAAMLTKTIDEEKESKLIVFANTLFATNTQIPLSQQYYMYALNAYNNRDILLNSVSYLTQRETSITIRKTADTITNYDVSAQEEQIVTIIIYTIPAVIIVLGIVIWLIRRRKK